MSVAYCMVQAQYLLVPRKNTKIPVTTVSMRAEKQTQDYVKTKQECQPLNREAR